ncbi:Dihydropteroate synthase [Multifurca ochricompacta]|uniref:Dihydropteroate synthase n=1 Tax=Multifurca ochricompacta TaxID=376703 RepID=A0AAD4M334_9AGAM|nr:Dihydropteroate synthase [Multifurca ochricompacta]
MTVDVVKPKALPYADGIRIRSFRSRDGSRFSPDRFSIQQLSCNLVVGLNPCEREDKQLVCFDVDISVTSEQRNVLDLRRLARDIRQEAESSEFISLESLASLAAQVALRHADHPDNIVTVRAMKPKALVFADAAEVEVVRASRDYPVATKVGASTPGVPSLALDPPVGTVSFPGQHLAAIALGSNLGDRFANIEAALYLLERPEHLPASQEIGMSSRITIVNTSFLYETAPMYVTDQPRFLNCACIIRTAVSPLVLLGVLKNIEHTMGRVPALRYGPRAVDLDVLFYDNEVIDTRPESSRGSLEGLEGHLVVPHPRIAEREFVLRPLYDMAPDFVHPVLRKPIREMLSDILKTCPAGSPAMIKVMPFPTYPHSPILAPPVAIVPEIPHTHRYWKFPPSRSLIPTGQVSTSRRTHIMATLNVTPDSFSDGSDHNVLSAALDYTTSSVSTGADIVDVGGYSTRPGAAYVSPDEEIARVIPVINGIRALGSDKARNVLISVDTFRPDVARAAIIAGANCINDVYAFTGPDYPHTTASAAYFEDMKKTARELVVPVILMHSRGDAGANKDYSRYSSVLSGVAQELGEKVEAIVRGPGGVRRWLVMIDPGIGFSKSVDGNLEVLRGSASISTEVRAVDGTWNPLRGYPQLIGASRKSFLRFILSQRDHGGSYEGRETAPKERGWATAAAVAAAVQQGASIVRVHDVLELGDVVRVADTIWG